MDAKTGSPGGAGGVAPGFELKSHRSGVVYLAIEKWEPLGARAVFATRQGGMSGSPYQSLNLGFRPGEDRGTVLANRKRFFEATGLCSMEKWLCRQRHTDNVVCVDDAENRASRVDDVFVVEPAEVDGLSTGRRGVALFTIHADCVPIYLFDPVNMAICLAHAGWRGTAAKMAEAAIYHLGRRFRSDPSRCLAAIGPCVGSCCYEVDEPVAERFAREGWDMDGLFIERDLPENTGERNERSRGRGARRWLLDLKEANRRSLVAAGVAPENIVVSNLCTCCRGDLFYSHRRQGERAGRMLAGLALL